MLANSRDVAAMFGKRHGDVLRDLRALISKAPELGVRYFALTPFIDPQNGESYEQYQIDRDGFTLLAMGFTGPKALKSAML